MSNRHPSSILDAADVVRVDRSQRGLFRPAIIHDVELLVITFAARDRHDYTDFLQAWNELQFYLVHFGAMEEEDRPRFLQAFYDAAMVYISSNQPSLQIASIYTLYFVYYSQPPCWERFGIRVDSRRWRQLHEFYLCGATDVSNNDHARAALAFRQMLDDSAFIFVAETTMKPVDPFEIEEMQPENQLIQTIHAWREWRTNNDVSSATIIPSESSQFHAVSDAYQRAKQLVMAAPQAPLVAQGMLRKKTTVTERNRSTLQRVLQNSMLGSNEKDFQNTLAAASRAMWDARLKRLEKKPAVFNAIRRQRSESTAAGPSVRQTQASSQPRDQAAAVDTQYLQEASPPPFSPITGPSFPS